MNILYDVHCKEDIWADYIVVTLLKVKTFKFPFFIVKLYHLYLWNSVKSLCLQGIGGRVQRGKGGGRIGGGLRKEYFKSDLANKELTKL